jgi:hypothetical protein
LQGILRKIRGFAQQRLSVAQSFQTLGRKFPREASREFFRASREVAGNAFAKIGNLFRRDFIAQTASSSDALRDIDQSLESP